MKTIRQHQIPSEYHAAYAVYKWCKLFKKCLEEATTLEDIEQAKALADATFGIRSLAVEVLLSPYSQVLKTEDVLSLCKMVGEAGVRQKFPDMVSALRSQMASIWPGLLSSLAWVSPKEGESFNFYRWHYERSLILLEHGKNRYAVNKVPIEELLAECKSASQTQALSSLDQLGRAINSFDGQLGNLELRRCAWIVGPSGSGKTWVAQQFAKTLGMPIYTTTVASWSLRNSKSTHVTIEKILSLLESGPITVLIDEICKIRVGIDNSNWFRAVQDEIMSLATKTLQDFNPSSLALRNLEDSWILYCGAFQDLYRAKLGKEVCFAEEVEQLSLSHEDILQAGWLPDELINRMGTFMEVKPPTVEELAVAMEAVEKIAGIEVSKKSRDAAASDSITRMSGFRGLQEYAMKCVLLSAQTPKKAPLQEEDDDLYSLE
jgi:hypothetical protein